MAILTTNAKFFKSKLIQECFDFENEGNSLWCALCKPQSNSQQWDENKIYQKLSDNTTEIVNDGLYYSIYFIGDLSTNPNSRNYIVNIMMSVLSISESEALSIYNADSIVDRLCYTATDPKDYQTTLSKLDQIKQSLLFLPDIQGRVLFDIAAQTNYDTNEENLPVQLSNNITNNVFFPNGIFLRLINVTPNKKSKFIEYLILNKHLSRTEAIDIVNNISWQNQYTLYNNITFNNVDKIVNDFKYNLFGTPSFDRDTSSDIIFRIPPLLNKQNNLDSSFCGSLNPGFSPADITEVTGLVSFSKIKDIYFCEKCKKMFSVNIDENVLIENVDEEKLLNVITELINRNKNYCLLFDIADENKTIEELINEIVECIMTAISSVTEKTIIDSKKDFVKIKNVIRGLESAGVLTEYIEQHEEAEFNYLYENDYSLLNIPNEENIDFENIPIDWKKQGENSSGLFEENFYLAIELEDEVKNNALGQVDNIGRIFMFSNLVLDSQYQEKTSLTIEEINNGAILDIGHCVIEDYFIPYTRVKDQKISIRYVVKI